MGIFDQVTDIFEQGRKTVQVNLRLTPEVRDKLLEQADFGGYNTKGDSGAAALVTDFVLGKYPKAERSAPRFAQPPEAVFAEDARTASYIRRTIRLLCDRVEAQTNCDECAEIGIALQEIKAQYLTILKAMLPLYEKRVLATKGDKWTG